MDGICHYGHRAAGTLLYAVVSLCGSDGKYGKCVGLCQVWEGVSTAVSAWNSLCDTDTCYFLSEGKGKVAGKYCSGSDFDAQYVLFDSFDKQSFYVF